MAKLLGWLRQQGAWIRSSRYELPAVQDTGVPADLQQWCALAGGLALVLSRESPADVPKRYPLADAVFERIRHVLQQGEEPRISRRVLMALATEIDAVADPLTKASCLACLRARDISGTSTGSNTLSLSGAPRRELPDAQRADFDDQVTQLSLEVFSRRSEQLRRTVAGARLAEKT